MDAPVEFRLHKQCEETRGVPSAPHDRRDRCLRFTELEQNIGSPPMHFIPRRMTTTGAESGVNIFCILVMNEYSISAEGQTLGSLWIVQCWHLGLVYCSTVKVWVYEVLDLAEEVNIKNLKFILLDSANISELGGYTGFRLNFLHSTRMSFIVIGTPQHTEFAIHSIMYARMMFVCPTLRQDSLYSTFVARVTL